MKTRKTINANPDTVKFAEHFKTKSSIKNLLKKVPNAKDISVLFENTKYGKEILEYSNLNDQFDIILSDVFKTYTAKVVTWRATGDNRSLPVRVELFRDLVVDRMKQAPEIGGTLGDFMKSATGKEINKVLTDAGIKEDEDLYLNIIIMIATRAFINNVMVEVETVVENAGHSTVSTKKPEESHEVIVIEEKPKMSKEVQKIIEMISSMSATVSDDEIRRFVSIIKPFVPDVIDELYKEIDKCTMTHKIWTSDTVQRIVRELKRSEMLDDRMKGLLAYIASKFCNDSDIIARDIFFIIIDLINHSTEDEHLYQDAKYIIRLMKSKENMGAFFEEMRAQDSRILDIIDEFNGVNTGVQVRPTTALTPSIPVTTEHKNPETSKEASIQPTEDKKSELGAGVARVAASFIRSLYK